MPSASEAPIAYFQTTVTSDEDVGGLDVTMQNSILVDIEHAFEELAGEGMEVVLGEIKGMVARSFEHVQKVGFAVLKDHVDRRGDVRDGPEVVLFSLGGGGRRGCATAGGGSNFLEADHVLVRHTAEELDFTEGGDWELN